MGAVADIAVSRDAARARRLHRALQRVEAPFRSRIARLEQELALAQTQNKQTLTRLCAAYAELRKVFQSVARLRAYPQSGQALHSVSDLRFVAGQGFVADPEVWANCFLTKEGGIESYKVADEVAFLVDSLTFDRADLAAHSEKDTETMLAGMVADLEKEVGLAPSSPLPLPSADLHRRTARVLLQMHQLLCHRGLEGAAREYMVLALFGHALLENLRKEWAVAVSAGEDPICALERLFPDCENAVSSKL